MIEADNLFIETLQWLRNNYSNFHFFVERDLVWTIHLELIRRIEMDELQYKVFNDYPMLPGNRRSLSTDLAIISGKDKMELAAEFKYEPNHRREDILKNKFSVVDWGNEGVAKDIKRIQEFVASGKTRLAYAIFIDEGGYFRHRPTHAGCKWIDWENGVSVYIGKSSFYD